MLWHFARPPPPQLFWKFDLCIYIDTSLIFDSKIYTLSPPPKYLQITPWNIPKKKKKNSTDLPFCPIAPRIIEKPTLKPETQTSPLFAMCCVRKRL